MGAGGNGNGQLVISFAPDGASTTLESSTTYEYRAPDQYDLATDLGKAVFAVAMQAYTTGAHVKIWCLPIINGTRGYFKDLQILPN
jgi:hypothetical protein